MVKLKKYYDGVTIPAQLPANYRRAKDTKKCSNCKFYQKVLNGGICSKWKALVRNVWVCNAWKRQSESDRMITRRNESSTMNGRQGTPNNNSNMSGNTSGGGY